MCNLESPNRTRMMEKFSHINESDINYITAKDIEPNHGDFVTSSTIDIDKKASHTNGAAMKHEADSVISFRNCSTILHASSVNHTIYRETSPSSEAAVALVRKTSTPMHQNMMAGGVAAGNSESMMCSSSSASCHVSSIHHSVTSPESSPDYHSAIDAK